MHGRRICGLCGSRPAQPSADSGLVLGEDGERGVGATACAGGYASPWAKVETERGLVVDGQSAAFLHRCREVVSRDGIIVVGDIFDEGYSASDKLFASFAARHKAIFVHGSSSSAPVALVVGNHDADDGRRHSLRKVRRFEEIAGGPVNGAFDFLNLSMARIDSMATHAHAPESVRSELKMFLQGERQKVSDGIDILLTHMPLFRKNDANCGPLRAAEAGGTTYNHPLESYAAKDVVSKAFTEDILNTLQPRLVLSGHTHALCHSKIDGKEKRPRRSYSRRGHCPSDELAHATDPGYAIVDYAPAHGVSKAEVRVTMCSSQ